MNGRRVAPNTLTLLLVSSAFAVAMWTYAQRVVGPTQIADGAAHGRPRGNLSDLYPRWLGARELLLHGKDPYSEEVTRQIQEGFYGRALDSSRPEDPKDREAFAYPVYVAFYLAPTIHLPFDVVRKGYFWILVGLTILNVVLWLKVLRWQLSRRLQASILALTLGSLYVMQGLKLQQFTLFVAALIAVAMALIVAERAIPAGIVLALATIKPQLVCGLLLWLAAWALGNWRRRYPLFASFFVTMCILVGASEYFLPHWIPRFWQALREYQDYTGAVPMPELFIPLPWSRLVEAAVAVATIYLIWQNRKHGETTNQFASVSCLVLASTLVLIPNVALYNHVLMLPALLLFGRDRRPIWEGNSSGRFLWLIVVFLLFWPWLTAAVLAGLSFVLPLESFQKAWTIPAWTSLVLPLAVAALAWVVAFRLSSSAPPEACPS